MAKAKTTKDTCELEKDFTRVPKNFIYQLADLTFAEIKIYLVLCEATNNEPKTWRRLTRRYFVTATGLTEKTITGAIEELKKKGLIGKRENANSFDFIVKNRTFKQKEENEQKAKKVETEVEENKDTYGKNKVIITPKNEVMITQGISLPPKQISFFKDKLTNIREQQQRQTCCCSRVGCEKTCNESELERLRKLKNRDGTYKYKSAFCRPAITLFLANEIRKLERNTYTNVGGAVTTLQQTGGRDKEIQEFLLNSLETYGIDKSRESLENAEQILKAVVAEKTTIEPSKKRDQKKLYDEALRRVTGQTNTNKSADDDTSIIEVSAKTYEY